MWKGGRCLDVFGYVMLKALDHPYANARGYVREHRLVIEKKLKRYLEPYEKVHHINGIKTDNRPENLELMTLSEHVKLHGLAEKGRKAKALYRRHGLLRKKD
jgi:hypothetical protein